MDPINRRHVWDVIEAAKQDRWDILIHSSPSLQIAQFHVSGVYTDATVTKDIHWCMCVSFLMQLRDTVDLESC